MASGPMQYGVINPDAGPDQTIMRSSVPLNPQGIPTATLAVRNTGSGAAIYGEQMGTHQRPAVSGANVGGIGVSGESEASTGVVGGSDNGDGVHGISNRRNGVLGESTVRNGVEGHSGSRSASGVYGENFSGGGFGIAGRSNAAPVPIPFTTSTGAAVLADNPAGGLALAIRGTAYVTGFLAKLGGGFVIDNPVDPANSYLCHSFVESPDMMNVYNGEATTDAEGNATVELPSYFEALNRDFHYQLTVIGQFAQAIVADEIRGNRFSIKTDKPDVRVSWLVTGIRQDAWANANRFEAEVDKPEGERGKYLAPREHGQPEEAGIHYAPPLASEGAEE